MRASLPMKASDHPFLWIFLFIISPLWLNAASVDGKDLKETKGSHEKSTPQPAKEVPEGYKKIGSKIAKCIRGDCENGKGVLDLLNGYKIKGLFVKGYPVGDKNQITHTKQPGFKYIGSLDQSFRPHGAGMLKLHKKGPKIYSNFNHGKYDGEVSWHYPNGLIQTGNTDPRGKRQGIIKTSLSQKSLTYLLPIPVIQGEFKDDRPVGWHILKLCEDCDIYARGLYSEDGEYKQGSDFYFKESDALLRYAKTQSDIKEKLFSLSKNLQSKIARSDLLRAKNFTYCDPSCKMALPVSDINAQNIVVYLVVGYFDIKPSVSIGGKQSQTCEPNEFGICELIFKSSGNLSREVIMVSGKAKNKPTPIHAFVYAEKAVDGPKVAMDIDMQKVRNKIIADNGAMKQEGVESFTTNDCEYFSISGSAWNIAFADQSGKIKKLCVEYYRPQIPGQYVPQRKASEKECRDAVEYNSASLFGFKIRKNNNRIRLTKVCARKDAKLYWFAW